MSIAAIAEARYAANPDPALPASAFKVQGGSVYAAAEGYDDRSWKPEALWMPRLSFGYRLGERMAVKGGYGIYYDTLNARDWTPNLQGFNVTTSNPLSVDFGRTFLLGDPRNGILPLADPFPVRATTGSRYESVLGNVLGPDTMVGQGFNAENPNRTHARVQRWRLSWQREIASRTAVEVAYSGSYGDRQSITIRQDFLPEEYWSGANFRDTSANAFLTANVTNPFNIANFASLQTTNPQLYQRMAGNAFFTAPTIQRHRLLRAFPHMNNLSYLDQPLGVIKAHTLEVVLTQRYAYGLTGHAAFSANRVTENRTVEEYDREPTLWQTNNNGRPWRLTGVGVYELPFGPGRAFLDNGGVFSHLARGWSLSGTYEYQPGALLERGHNLFFNGDLDESRRTSPRSRFCPMARSTRPRPGSTPRVREGHGRSAGRLPEAGVPVPGRRSSRPESVNGQYECRAHVQSGRHPDVPVPDGRAEPLQPAALRQPEPEPDEHGFGQVRTVNNTVMRFITFNTTLRF